MNGLKYSTALLTVLLGLVCRYYVWTGRLTPPWIFYSFVVSACACLVLFLISFAQQPPPRRW